MVKNKLVLILPFIILVVIAWSNVNDSSKRENEKIEMQQELIAQADAFINDGIYSRAEESLMSAYKLNVGDKEIIMQKLLNVYKLNNDMSSWCKTLEKRIENVTASDNEIEELLTYYMDNARYEAALNTAISCLEGYPENQTAMEIKETVLYEYSFDEKNYANIGDTGSRMAVCDNNDMWYIMDPDAKNNNAYEYAWSFSPNGSYGAVSENGKIYIIDSSYDKYSLCHEKDATIKYVDNSSVIVEIDGMYYISNHEMNELSEEYSFAGTISDGIRAVSKSGKWYFLGADIDSEYEGIAVNEMGQSFVNDRAFVMIDGKYIMIDDKGCHVGEESYADACPFMEKNSLAAVKNSAGKWGFIDKDGKLVIDYQYDNACSFSCSAAAVQENGSWGYINMNQKVIIPCQFSEARAFVKGCAYAKGDKGWGIIKFKYYNFF